MLKIILITSSVILCLFGFALSILKSPPKKQSFKVEKSKNKKVEKMLLY